MSNMLSGFFGGIPAHSKGQESSGAAQDGSMLPVVSARTGSEPSSGQGFENLLQGEVACEAAEVIIDENASEALLVKDSGEGEDVIPSEPSEVRVVRPRSSLVSSSMAQRQVEPDSVLETARRVESKSASNANQKSEPVQYTGDGVRLSESETVLGGVSTASSQVSVRVARGEIAEDSVSKEAVVLDTKAHERSGAPVGKDSSDVLLSVREHVSVNAAVPVAEIAYNQETTTAPKGRLLEFMRDVLGDGDISDIQDSEPPEQGESMLEKGISSSISGLPKSDDSILHEGSAGLVSSDPVINKEAAASRRGHDVKLSEQFLAEAGDHLNGLHADASVSNTKKGLLAKESGDNRILPRDIPVRETLSEGDDEAEVSKQAVLGGHSYFKTDDFHTKASELTEVASHEEHAEDILPQRDGGDVAFFSPKSHGVQIKDSLTRNVSKDAQDSLIDVIDESEPRFGELSGKTLTDKERVYLEKGVESNFSDNDVADQVPLIREAAPSLSSSESVPEQEITRITPDAAFSPLSAEFVADSEDGRSPSFSYSQVNSLPQADDKPLPLKERLAEFSGEDPSRAFSVPASDVSLKSDASGVGLPRKEQVAHVVSQPSIYGQMRSSEREPVVFVESKSLFGRVIDSQTDVASDSQGSGGYIVSERTTDQVATPQSQSEVANVSVDTNPEQKNVGVSQKEHSVVETHFSGQELPLASNNLVKRNESERVPSNQVPVLPQEKSELAVPVVPLNHKESKGVSMASTQESAHVTSALKEGQERVASFASGDPLPLVSHYPEENQFQDSSVAPASSEKDVHEDISLGTDTRNESEFTRSFSHVPQMNEKLEVGTEESLLSAEKPVLPQSFVSKDTPEGRPVVESAREARESLGEQQESIQPAPRSENMPVAHSREHDALEAHSPRVAKDSAQTLSDLSKIEGKIPHEASFDVSKDVHSKDYVEVLSKAGMPIAQHAPRMQSKLQRISEGQEGLPQVVGKDFSVASGTEHIRREMDTVPFVNMPSEDSVEASASHDNGSQGFSAPDNAKDAPLIAHRTQNNIAPQSMESFSSKMRSESLPSVPDLNPKLLRQLEQFHRSQRPWAKVSLPMGAGEDLMLRMKVSSGRVQIRFGTQSIPLQEGLKSGWSELITHAASLGILLDEPEFEERVRARMPAFSSALLDGSNEEDGDDLKVSKRRSSASKSSIEAHEPLDNYSSVLKWA